MTFPFSVIISARIATTAQGATISTSKSYGSFNSSFRTKFLVLKKIKWFCQKSATPCLSVGSSCWKTAMTKPQKSICFSFSEEERGGYLGFPEAAPTPESESSGRVLRELWCPAGPSRGALGLLCNHCQLVTKQELLWERERLGSTRGFAQELGKKRN